MEKIIVDDGQKFDFGRISKEYAKYRNIYPEELFKRLHELGIGKKGSRWLDCGVAIYEGNMARQNDGKPWGDGVHG